MKMSNKPPTKPGYYWFFDGTEHTPAILRVEVENYFGARLLKASNEEFGFTVEQNPNEFWSKEISQPVITKKMWAITRVTII